MHIYFINYHKFKDSSGIHIHFLANALVDLGVACTAVVPNHPESIHTFGDTRYDAMTYGRFKRKAVLTPWTLRTSVLHAWTPRELVRRTTRWAVACARRPYFVHLEDNEEHVFQGRVGVAVQDRQTLSPEQRRTLPLDVIDPFKYQSFLGRAAGVTCIIDGLKRFVPDHVPATTFWPACEPEFFAMPPEPDRKLRHALGIPDSATVLTYTGNVHPSNLADMQSLYDAVVLLNRQGREVYLLRCGRTDVPLSLPEGGAPYILEMGDKAPVELIDYIGCADILAQPGQSDLFNDNRFPSKLPMFLASGRPVILPLSNIGHHMHDGTDCLLLRDGTAEELATRVATLMDSPELARSIGQAGRDFAAHNLSWATSAKKVLALYESCLATR